MRVAKRMTSQILKMIFSISTAIMLKSQRDRFVKKIYLTAFSPINQNLLCAADIYFFVYGYYYCFYFCDCFPYSTKRMCTFLLSNKKEVDLTFYNLPSGRHAFTVACTRERNFLFLYPVVRHKICCIHKVYRFVS